MPTFGAKHLAGIPSEVTAWAAAELAPQSHSGDSISVNGQQVEPNLLHHVLHGVVPGATGNLHLITRLDPHPKAVDILLGHPLLPVLRQIVLIPAVLFPVLLGSALLRPGRAGGRLLLCGLLRGLGHGLTFLRGLGHLRRVGLLCRRSWVLRDGLGHHWAALLAFLGLHCGPAVVLLLLRLGVSHSAWGLRAMRDGLVDLVGSPGEGHPLLIHLELLGLPV
mmetsp:Transcript_2466/g.5540  ORF Transcript_2466/g.5540 Transcript_2466/m.5540 type:complete len:221 (+) Transcript_2466:499-1161(+)